MSSVSTLPLNEEKEKQALLAKEPYLKAFSNLEKKIAGRDPLWLKTLRHDAISHFAQTGFPTLRQEDWKYTSVEPITRSSFHFHFGPSLNPLLIEKIKPFLFGQVNWNRLVFVNGFYVKELSFVTNAARNLRIGSIADAISNDSNVIITQLSQDAVLKQSGFAALNTAFFQDGAFIHLPKNAVVDQPIYLLYVSTSPRDKAIVQPRNLILAGARSHATIIENFVSLADDSYFTNSLTQIILSQGAAIDHYKIQKESYKAFHIGTTEVSQNRDSRFASYALDFGGGLVRNNLNVRLEEEGASCSLHGLYLTTHNQHVDNHTRIDHLKPRGTSRQIYKGVLDAQSRAVFNGKVFVRRDAQQTDAQQTNKNLLLSKQATVDTKPQLEISADDVKCTHGAAVGQLEEEAIFYLKSRGIDEMSARNLLTYGFASEVIDSIRVEPLRSSLKHSLWAWLGKESFIEVASGG